MTNPTQPNPNREVESGTTGISVIFLDIDGVLVTLESFQKYKRSGMNAQASPPCVEQLNRIVAETGARIVLSSTWRIFGRAFMEQNFIEWGVSQEIYDFTPELSCNDSFIEIRQSRGTEIQAWLTAHPEVKQFVIIDDDDDMEHLKPNLVKTGFNEGLTPERANAVIHGLTP